VPDNVAITAGAGTSIATDEVSGTLEHVQVTKLAISADGSRTFIPADATNGLAVDVTRLPALPAGTNAIGSITNTSFAVTQSTAANLNATAVLATGDNTVGRVRITDGTNTVPIDTVHADGESATENHLDVAAKTMGLNGAGTFDIIRANVNVNKTATYAAAQTGTALWTPAAGKAVVITNLQIQSYGTTAGTCTVWFGGAADTTYTRGTDFPIFDGEFAPSATNKPGVINSFVPGVRGAADFVLRVTTTNAQSVTISVWGYEI